MPSTRSAWTFPAAGRTRRRSICAAAAGRGARPDPDRPGAPVPGASRSGERDRGVLRPPMPASASLRRPRRRGASGPVPRRRASTDGRHRGCGRHARGRHHAGPGPVVTASGIGSSAGPLAGGRVVALGTLAGTPAGDRRQLGIHGGRAPEIAHTDPRAPGSRTPRPPAGIEQELALGRELQRSFVGLVGPEIPGYDLACHYEAGVRGRWRLLRRVPARSGAGGR